VDHHLRRRSLADRLDDLGVDALLVTRPLNVRYLTGFTGSNAQALVGRAETVFFTDGRYTEQSRHEAPDVERVTYAQTYREVLPSWTDGVVRLGIESTHQTVAAHATLAEALPEIELVSLGGAVEGLREVKDPEEIGLLDRAQEATDAAFEAVLDVLSAGIGEQQVAWELERLLRAEGADGNAFDPVVAFGENAAEPHHAPGHRLLEEGDLVKLDFGGRVEGYHADMTRTVAFGTLGGELRKIYDVVRQAQEAGVDTVRAGATGAEIDAACRTVIENAGYGDRFVHGTGHGVGLEVHEGPWLGRAHEEALPAGAVVTVEPGIYVPGLGGVRIEDMVEVTDEGGRVLGRSTRELIEL
jgi:Xaa-Pro aminopeptidase